MVLVIVDVRVRIGEIVELNTGMFGQRFDVIIAPAPEDPQDLELIKTAIKNAIEKL